MRLGAIVSVTIRYYRDLPRRWGRTASKCSIASGRSCRWGGDRFPKAGCSGMR